MKCLLCEVVDAVSISKWASEKFLKCVIDLYNGFKTRSWVSEYSQRSILRPHSRLLKGLHHGLPERHFPEPETSWVFIDPHSLCQQTYYSTPQQSSMWRKTQHCQVAVMMERDLWSFVNTADKCMDGWEEAGHPRGVSEERVVSVTPQREQDKCSWHTLRSLLNKYRRNKELPHCAHIIDPGVFHHPRQTIYPNHSVHMWQGKKPVIYGARSQFIFNGKDGRCQKGGWTAFKACALLLVQFA